MQCNHIRAIATASERSLHCVIAWIKRRGSREFGGKHHVDDERVCVEEAGDDRGGEQHARERQESSSDLHWRHDRDEVYFREW